MKTGAATLFIPHPSTSILPDEREPTMEQLLANPKISLMPKTLARPGGSDAREEN